ncbi:hypothetical protein [Viscerimonas tarda]
MNRDELVLRHKIISGLNMTCDRLLEKKQKEDGNLVFFVNGEIVKIKARKLEEVNASPILIWQD